MAHDATFYGGTSAPVSPATLKGGEPNVTGSERWISLVGGGALATYGIRQGGALGALLAVTGAGLIARGATGQGPVKRALTATPYERHVAEERGWSSAATASYAVTIDKPREEIYRFFRDFSNLPRFMEHVEEIRVLDDRRSHWKVKAPAGQSVEWTSRVTDDRPGERIDWSAEEDASVKNAGWVEFEDAKGGRGTVVRAMIAYQPPMWQAGRIAAKLFRREPAVQVRTDLKRLKMLMETGEVATSEPGPAAPRAA